MRRWVIGLLLILPILVGCGGNNGADGAFVIGLEGSPTNLDPRYATDAYSTRITPLLFDNLIDNAPDGSFLPGLAESWDVENGTVYTFHLRKGVRFHDGRPFTSADVRYTFEYMMNPDNKCPAAGSLKEIASIETPDDFTIVFRLDKVFVPAMFKFVKGIVPAHVGDDPDFGRKLVGTGPYRLTDLQTGERVELAAFSDYHGGAPSIENIRFEVVRSDTTRMLRLQKGDLQLVQNAVQPHAIKFFERMDSVQVLRAPGVNFSYIGFNLQDHRGITSKRKVRRAIAHAINRAIIIDALLKGQARVADGLLAPENRMYNPDVPTYDYDPEQAKRLLDEAGFPDPDGDGPDVRFTLSYKTSTNNLRNRIGEILAEQLAQVGIGTEKRSYEWGTFYADIKKGNFQTFTLSWVGITDPDIFHYIFHSSNQPPNGANRGRYINPEIDALIDKTRIETDPEIRKALFFRIQEILARDLVYVGLWWADNIVVATKNLHGFEILPGGQYTSLAKATWEPRP